MRINNGCVFHEVVDVVDTAKVENGDKGGEDGAGDQGRVQLHDTLAVQPHHVKELGVDEQPE